MRAKKGLVVLGVSLMISAFSMTSMAIAQDEAPAPAPAAATEGAAAKKDIKNITTKEIQEALVKAGAKIKVDGKKGKQLTAALKEFQKANGLKETGKLDAETAAKLTF